MIWFKSTSPYGFILTHYETHVKVDWYSKCKTYLRLSVAPCGTADAIFELQTLKGFKTI